MAYRATKKESPVMKMSKAFPSKYLAADDFEAGDRALQIAGVRLEDVSIPADPTDIKPIVTFAGHDKEMVLNKTNYQTLVDLFGDESDNWVGETATFFRDFTEFKGQRVPCVRIRTKGEAPTLGDYTEGTAPPF